MHAYRFAKAVASIRLDDGLETMSPDERPSVLERVRQVWTAQHRAACRRRDMRKLHRMPDHALHDIGISRAGIESAVCLGRRG